MVSLALAALTLASCPHDPSLGTVTFVRSGTLHRVALDDCVEHPAGAPPKGQRGPLRSPEGRLAATIRPSGRGRNAKQTIWVTDRRTGRSRPVFAETQYYRRVGPGETPGPIMLLGWSGDGRWLFFAIDPDGSASIAADGLTLRVVSAEGGRVHKVGVALAHADYRSWCHGRLVFTAGADRVATHNKRLLVAGPPDWRPRPLWRDAKRAFGPVACAPDGGSVAVLSQSASTDARFFHTRWRLWRVGLDGSRQLLDRPPPGFADESPRWSKDGRSLLFVRERNGYGSLMLWRRSRLYGPIADLGYSLGYYGHHDWLFEWQK